MHPIVAGTLRLARKPMEPLLVLAAIAVLRRFGLAGDVPLWVFALTLGAGTVLRQPGVQLRLSGGDLANKVTNDAAAKMRTIAETYGRNVDVAESFVTEAASITAVSVIDLIKTGLI